MKTLNHHNEFFSIAVLPFKNMTNDESLEFLGYSIAEEIINVLTRLEIIEVISLNSSMYSEISASNIDKVHRDQIVNYVIEGSVFKMNSNIRIMFHLVDVKSGKYLYSESASGTLEQIDLIQQEISQIILDRYNEISQKVKKVAYNNFIEIQTNTKNGYKVSLDQVAFVKAFDNYSIVYCKNGNEFVRKTLRVTIKSIEEQFNSSNMFRSHRSYLVNLNSNPKVIKSSNKYFFNFDEYNELIPIARAKVHFLKEISFI